MKRKYLILLPISIIGVILDQVTKHWAKGLEYNPPITIIENFFHFIYVENRGAAWSLFSDMSDSIRTPFFVVISLIALSFIAYFFRKLEDEHVLLTVSLSCVLSGAIGNFIDRIAYGSVIDFIDWHYYQHHWPTFNIADVFISVGVGLMVIEIIFGNNSLFMEEKPEENQADKTSS